MASSKTTDASERFDTLNIPLTDLVKSGGVTFDGSRSLSINGQLRANNSFVINPSGRPTSAVAGQIYYDQATNELAYYNGADFVNLTGQTGDIVESVGGVSGAVGVGTGLTAAGNQLTNSGVLSFQGQTGDITLTAGDGVGINGTVIENTGVLSVQGQIGNVTFTAGDGIAVDGTTLTNTGVLSLGGESGELALGTGLAVSDGVLETTGVQSLTAGTVNLIVNDDGNGNLTISSVGGGSGTVNSPNGTAGRIAKFTGAQTIEDSLLSESGTTVTVNGDLAVTGAVTLTTPLAVTSGGTGATTSLGARTVLGAAASGANSDITSLSGLTTALSVAQGGTGVSTIANNGIVIGQGTGAIATVTAGGAGLCLLSTAGAPSFQACPAGITSLNGLSGSALTIANASGSGSTITIDDASDTAKGIASFNNTNFSVVSGNVNTIQNINAGATPTFAGINTNSIVASGPTLTVGSTSQNTTLQGANTNITEVNGANSTTLTFVAPTANVTYRLQTAAAGTYDVCTTAGNCVALGGAVTTVGGTANQLARFSGGQTIVDSIISDDGALVTVAGDLRVAGTVTFDVALAVTQGGTGAVDATGARTNLGAAASGANSDITSLSGLTTALSVVQGGTGATSLTAGGLLIGNGTSPVSSLVGSVIGECLLYGVTGPEWSTCPSSSVNSLNGLMGNLTIANVSASGSTITIDDASTSTKGIASFNSTNFTVSSGEANTIQDINTGATPTFAGINTNSINPSTALTVGATGQDLTLQGANTVITATDSGSTTTLSFAAPTADVTYRLQTAAAGTYDVCTTVGNCTGVGGGVTSPGGATNTLAKFTGPQTIGDSIISDDGSLVTIAGDLQVTGTVTFDTPLAITQGGTGAVDAAGARSNLNAATAGANSDITSLSGLTTALSVVQGGTGAASLTANGVLLGNGTSAISSLAAGGAGLCLVSTAGAPTWAACPGGGGVTSVNGLSGSLTIANASAAGSTITINDASTSQKGIASFNSTNFSVTSGAVNTVQNINTAAAPTFAALTLSSSQASNPMLLVNNTNASGTGNLLTLQLNGSDRLAISPAGNMTLTGTINGQAISSTANFTGTLDVAGTTTLDGDASVGGTLTANTITPNGAMTVGATGQSLLLQGNSATAVTATSGSDTTTVSFQTPTADVTYRFLTAAAGTYDICTTAGNCAGVGGGVTTPGGTTNQLAKFTGGQTLGDSIISDDGSTVTIAGALAVNNITPTAALTIGDLAEDVTLQGAGVAISASDGGVTNTLTFDTPSGGDKTITVPDASGTLVVSASGPLSIDAAGNITCPTCTTTGGGGGGAVDSLNGLNGVLTLANAAGVGSTITIDNASTSTKGIASFNSTNFSASSGAINTIQDINTTAAPTFGRLTVTGSEATNGMFVINNTNTGASGNLLNLQLNGSSRFAVSPSGALTLSSTVNGQTISSAASLTGTLAVAGAANLNGGATVTGTLTANTITPSGALTVGATAQAFTLQGNASSTITATNSGNTTGLAFETPTANVTYRLLTAAAGTYDICTTVGNCAAVAGGVTTAGGTTNTLAKFTAGQVIGDSIITDNGTTVTIGGTLAVNTITPSASMVVGATSQNLTMQGAITTITSTGAGNDIVLNSADTIELQDNTNVTGALSATGNINSSGGALQTNGTTRVDNSGNLVNIGNITGTGAVTIASTGAGNDIIIDGADILDVQDAAVFMATTTFNGVATFNADVTLAFADAEDLTITSTVTGTSAVDLLNMALTNNTSSGTQRVAVLQNQAGTGATEALLLLNNADTDTAVANGLQITSVAGAITTALDVSDSDIGTAMLFGANDITGTNFTVTGSNGNVTGGTYNGQTISAAASLTGTLQVAGATTLQTTLAVTGNTTLTGDLAVNGGDITSSGALNITPGGALTVGASGQILTVQGNASSTLSATSGSNTTTLAFASPSADTTLELPALAAGTYQLCTSGGNCTGVAATLQTAYDNSTNPEITLDATRGALTVRDASSALGANLFEIQNNAGGTTYFAVTSTGSSTAGTSTATGNINSSGGALQTNGTTRVDNSGNLTNIGTLTLSGAISGGTTVTGSGNFNTTGGTIQTNSTNRLDNSGNLVNIGNITGTGAVTIASTGAGNDIIINGADILDVQDATSFATTATFNGLATFNTDVDVTLAGSENVSITSTVTGTTSLDLVIGVLTNNTSSGTQRGALIQNGAGSGTTEALLVLDNADTDTALTTALQITAAAGGVTTAIDLTDSDIGDAINVGANNIVGTTGDIDLTNFDVTGSNGNTVIGGTLQVSSAGTFSSALGVSGTTTLSGDLAANGNTVIGNATSDLLTVAAILQGANALVFEGGTADASELTLAIDTLTGDQTITLPDETGTVCLRNSTACGFALSGGSAAYIQNQNAGQQTSSNFWISGTGRADTSLLAPLFDRADAGTLTIGGTATGITLADNTTASGTLDVTGATTLIGNLAANGDTTIGNANTDSLTINSVLQGASPLVFEGSTADANELTLAVAALTGDQTITLPDETGTVCLQNSVNCGFLTGTAANYIQNQNAGAQSSSDYWISGTGQADTALRTPLLDAAAAGTLSLGGTATAIALNENSTVTGSFTQSGGAFSLTGSGSTSTLTTTSTSLNISAGAFSTWQTTAGGLTITSGGSGQTFSLLTATNGTVILGGSNATTLNIGESNNARTINIGSSGTSNAQAINLGSTGSTSATAIRGGTGSTAITLQTGSGGTIGIGNAGVASTVQIGNTTGAVTQTIGLGNNATASSTSNVTIGSTIAGTTTIQGATGITVANNATFSADLAANGNSTIGDSNTDTLTITAVLQGASPLVLEGGTADANELTLAVATLTADRTITLPDETGTVCLQNSVNCGFLTGTAANYIQNQNAGQQTSSNFWLSGTGRADTSVQTPLLDTATAAALNIGTGNATGVNIATNAAAHTIAIGNGAAAQTITVGSTNTTSTLTLQGGTGSTALNLATGSGGSINLTTTGAGANNLTSAAGTVVRSSTNSGTAFQVQNSASNAIFNVDTSNEFVINNGVANPDNLLENPGFEAGATAANASGWNFPGSYSIATDAANARSGNKVLTATASTANIDAGTQKMIAVQPGDTYYLEGWVKTSGGANGNGGFYFEQKDKDKANATFTAVGGSYIAAPGTTYTKVSGTITIASGKYYLSVAVSVRSTATTGTWYFDDVRLRKVNTSGPSIMQSTTDTANAFQVQNASGASLFNIDTSAGQLTVSQAKVSILGIAHPTNFTLSSSASGGSLAAGTYYYGITAVAPSGETDIVYSSPTSAVTTGSSSRNTLSWSAVSGATSYKVYRSNDGGTTWYVNTIAAGTTSIIDNGSTYTWSTNAGSLIALASNSTANLIMQTGTWLFMDGGAGNGAAGLNYVSASNYLAVANYNAGGGIQVDGDYFNVRDTTGYHTNLSIANTGAATFAVRTNSTAAFQVQNQADVAQLLLDTQNSRLYVGPAAGDTTGTLLVLGTKTNSGDPSGVNGAMYYNEAMQQYRCYTSISSTEADGAWAQCGVNPIDRGFVVEDEFTSGNNANSVSTVGIGNSNWGIPSIIGSGCTTLVYNGSTYAPSANRPGVLGIPTAAATNAGCIVALTSGTGDSMVLTAGYSAKMGVAPGTTITNYGYRVGLTNSSQAGAGTGQPTTGVWWEAVDASSSSWRYCYADGTPTSQCSASAVSVTASTFVSLEIRVNSLGSGTSSADFFINGNKSSVSGVTINTTNRVSPSMQCFTTNTTAKSCVVDYWQVKGYSSAQR